MRSLFAPELPGGDVASARFLHGRVLGLGDGFWLTEGLSQHLSALGQAFCRGLFSASSQLVQRGG